MSRENFKDLLTDQGKLIMIKRWSVLSLIFLIFILGLCFRFYSLNSYVMECDEAEYLNIAKHFARGEGYLQSIKYSFFKPGPVTHQAIGERLFAFPLFLALPYYLFSSILVCKIWNILVGSILSTFLFFSLTKKLVSVRLALVASLLFWLNPILIDDSRLLMPESFFLFLSLSILNLTYRSTKKELSAIHCLLLGLLLSIAHFTRPEGLMLCVIIVIWLSCIGQRKQGLLIGLLFVALTIPYFIFNAQINGTPFYNVQNFNFSLKDFNEGIKNPFRFSYPSAFEFLSKNWAWAGMTVMWRAVRNFDELLGRHFISLLMPFSMLGLFWEKEKEKKFIVLLAVLSFIFFIIPTMAWGAACGANGGRYLLTCFAILLILCFRGIFLLSETTLVSKYYPCILSLPCLCLYLLAGINHVVEPPLHTLRNYQDESFRFAYEYLKKDAKSSSTIATYDPWSINTMTDLPSILLPCDLNSKQVKEFIRLYLPDYFLIARNDDCFFKISSDATSNTFDSIPQNFTLILSTQRWKLFKKIGETGNAKISS